MPICMHRVKTPQGSPTPSASPSPEADPSLGKSGNQGNVVLDCQNMTERRWRVWALWTGPSVRCFKLLLHTLPSSPCLASALLTLGWNNQGQAFLPALTCTGQQLSHPGIQHYSVLGNVQCTVLARECSTQLSSIRDGELTTYGARPFCLWRALLRLPNHTSAGMPPPGEPKLVLQWLTVVTVRKTWIPRGLSISVVYFCSCKVIHFKCDFINPFQA
ncbi:uncharacterized protein LOC131384399 [Hylobates moloch]|uniref:uncharacterized protein LOC131384399 n=1 Tax=Hylobates moloch TaxID=81572 RepID=UPI002674FCE7|nr:uncharacterized protein LOC131384399 [Hylobates moloch]